MKPLKTKSTSNGENISAAFEIYTPMITINFIATSACSSLDVDIKNQKIQAQTGQSLMQAAQAAGVHGIEADCGGMLTCATCHVYVHEPFASWLPAPDAEEQGMLEFTAEPRQANSRLSCQIMLTTALDGLKVDLPTNQH